MQKFFRFFLVILMLGILNCNYYAIAQNQSAETSKKQNIFSRNFNKLKSKSKAYKTQLEIKYYQELLKKNPDDVPTLEQYSKYLKDHRFYPESIKIYNKLYELTNNEKYKLEITRIKSFQKFENKEKTFLNYIEQAKMHEAKGNTQKANEYYLKAEKIFPGRFESSFGLAKTYGWLNNDSLAVQYYNKLLKEYPDNVYLLEIYGNFLKDNGQYAKTKEIYNRLFDITKNPKYKKDLQELILVEKGISPSTAGSKSAKELENEKIFFEYISQAQKYESKGNIQKANEYYIKAEKIFPHRFESSFGLAKTYGWLGQKKIAFEYYQFLLKEFSENQDLAKFYNKFLKEAKSPIKITKVATSQYKLSLGKDAEFQNLINQAQNFEIQGKTKQANEYYLKAERLSPSRFESSFGLAKTYGWLHKDELAKEYYGKLLRQNPNNIDLIAAYANYLKENKNYDVSMSLYNKLMSQTGDQKYNADIAEIFFLKKEYNKSLKLYSELYDKNPDNINIQKQLGLLYFILGDFDTAVEFYQKYLSVEKDEDSLLIYGKSLFYSQKIEQAKTFWEEYTKEYPQNIEGLKTLSELYLAMNQPQKAQEILNIALKIDPENLGLQIQSAKIEINKKNFNQAKNILCNLYKTNPQNSDIIENLGDISYYNGDFNQALSYYNAIPEPNDNINFKIAQSTHYNKNYEKAEYLYGQFLNNSKYCDRAWIGLAEIQISKNRPLQARTFLNNVLVKEPKNVQANKNLAISYYSTGDNFKSIKILESLPKDDSDVNYNLAKAYNAIERKDVALDLLRDNPQENAKKLENDILMQIKPAIEPLYNIYHMTGNANAGKYQKLGGNGYFYPRPNIKAIGSITTTEYKNVTNIQSTRGTLYSVGLEGRPHNKISFKSGIGINTFDNKGDLLLGSGMVKISPNDIVSFNSGYIRSLDEIDSYMSAAGVVPTTGPFAHQLVGRIVDNKFIVGNLAFKLPHKFYAYGGFNLGNKFGYNSPMNNYRELPAGFGKVVYSADENRHINQGLLGYDFYYTAYNADRSGFGGANLNYSPVGSDGGNPNPTAGNPGVGGYFSPTFFIANKIPVTLKGTFKKLKLKYILTAFGGTQTIEGQTGLVGGSGNMRTIPYYGTLITLNCNEEGKYGIRLDYSYNNYMSVEQHLFKVNLLFRF